MPGFADAIGGSWAIGSTSVALSRHANPRSSIINAANRVPENQRFYQQAYKAHTRVWMIVCRQPKLARVATPPEHSRHADISIAGLP